MKQPPDALIPDQESDHRQHEGAGKGREVAELSGAEDKTFVSRVSASVGIRKGSDHESACMSRHMQAIGDQCHRSPQKPADNLRNHHSAAQGNHGPTAPLISGVILAEKDVLMTPKVE